MWGAILIKLTVKLRETLKCMEAHIKDEGRLLTMRRNEPDLTESYFPAYCQECGIKAETPGEMDAHRHGRDMFAPEKPGQEPPKCSSCGSYIDPDVGICDDCHNEPIPDYDDLGATRYGDY
jgi:hypothetical protein